MGQNTKTYEVACQLLAGKREGWEVHPLQIGGDHVVVCAVDRGKREPDSVYAWISQSLLADRPFLVWIFRPEDDGEPFATGTVSEANLEEHVFAELALAERSRPEAGGERAPGERRLHFRRDEDRGNVDALRQIREEAQFPVGANLTDQGEQLRWAKAKLEHIAKIAEAGKPDEDWPGKKPAGTWSAREHSEGVWFVESAKERIGPMSESEAHRHADRLNEEERLT